MTPDVVRQELIDPDEYWGWPNGVAVRTQVLKRADVLQLFALIDIFPPEVMRANYLYYEPRTEHGSSLSPSAHALIASKAELPEEAFRYFEEASSIDLYNQSKKVMSRGSFLGGIHTAACGAVWFVVVQASQASRCTATCSGSAGPARAVGGLGSPGVQVEPPRRRTPP